MMGFSRICKDSYYLQIADAVSERSTCLRRRYGAVIVKNDEIIATGYNGAARGETNCCDIYDVCPRSTKEHNSGDYSDCPAVHAEQNALISASRADCLGATLYLYGNEIVRAVHADTGHVIDYESHPITDPKPCPICARMLKNAGIAKIVTLDHIYDPSTKLSGVPRP